MRPLRSGPKPLGTLAHGARAAALSLPLMLLAAACSAPTASLAKVARSPSHAELDRLYKELQSPLVFIGDTVFVPDCACLEQPCKRETGGATEVRDKAAQGEKRALAGDQENREAGAAKDGREQGKSKDAREQGASKDARRTDGRGEQRDQRAASDDRDQAGAAEKRDQQSKSERRSVESASDARDRSSVSEAREIGSAVSPLSCARTGHRRFRVFAAENQVIRFFDGARVVDADDREIRY